jgi:hypothetical protein
VTLGPLGLVDLDDPPLSLADDAIALAEEYLRVPSGVKAGEPLVLTPEQIEFLIEWYRVTPDGRAFVWQRGMLVGPKGWSKSPLGALDAFFDLIGGSIPDGLDAYGNPVGHPHPAPWIQIAGTSEDNTDNLYGQFYEALRDSPALDDYGIDLGLTRTFLTGRPGKVEPVTASSTSRTGNPVSKVLREETWLWSRTNGGHALAAALNQNARKMGARVLDLTNRWRPGTDSTAERTSKAVQAGRDRTLIVAIGGRPVPDIFDDAVALDGLRDRYGSHATERGGWVDLRQLLDDRPPGDTSEAQWRQLYLNEETAEVGDAFDPVAYQEMASADARLVEGDTIALGFDGSDTGDASALYAVRWPDWTVFALAVWERPSDPITGARVREWKVPRPEVKAKIRWALETFRVVRGYADPAHWQTEIDEFSDEFGESFMRFPHHSASRIGPACERWQTMFDERTLRFAPDPDGTLARHATNAMRVPCGPVSANWWRPGRKVEGQPIDAFSAAIAAVHALGDAVAAGGVAPAEDEEFFVY